MTHAAHFLQRLDRVPRSQVDFALSLYRDPELVRWIVAYAHPGPSEQRFAFSIDEARGPYVVVTRDGHFVTALAEGMSTGDLRVLPRSQVDAFAERVHDTRRRKELAGEITPPGKEPEDLLALLSTRPNHLTREEMTAIGGWNPLLWRDFFRGTFDVARDIEELVGTLVATKRRNPKLDDLAMKTWQLAHGIGARWLLTTMGELTWVEPVMGKWTDGWPPTLVSTRYRTLSIALRGWWAAARMGKHVLGIYRSAMHEEQSTLGLFDAALGATAIGLRHARCTSEAQRIVDLLPVAAGPVLGKSDWAREIVEGCTRALEDPDAAVEAALGGGRAIYGCTSRILAPVGSVLRAERDEDVTREQALLAVANYDGDCMLKVAMDVLPWVARAASPEDLYFPEESRFMYLPIVAARANTWVDLLRSDRVVAVTPHRREDRPGRNDACSCGSGKKFKRCCGG